MNCVQIYDEERVSLIRCGVVGNISVSHMLASGSIPGIGIFLPFLLTRKDVKKELCESQDQRCLYGIVGDTCEQWLDTVSEK